jgi:hypothetical protein
MNAIPSSTTAILTAAIAAAAALAKKFLGRNKPKPEYICRAEFHNGMDAVRDRIGASYLALAEKIELQHDQLLTALERQGTNFENRLDHLESAVARLDERTKL